MAARRLLAVLASGAILVIGLGTGVPTIHAQAGSASRVLLFVGEGMRPDMVDTYVAAGAMPTFGKLIASGVKGDNGLVPPFPPNSGVGTFTLATGTFPGEHGETNTTYFRAGDAFNNRTAAFGSGTLQADTLAEAAERAGRKVAQIEFSGGRDAGIVGPTVDYRNFFSARGVLAWPFDPAEQAGAAAFGLSYQVAGFAPAAGWTNVPASYSPAVETVLTVPTTFAAQNPNRTYNAYVYDSTDDAVQNYDHVLLVRVAAAKDGAQRAADLVAGDFREIALRGADGLIGARAGQSAGFYVKLIALAPDLSAFKLYFTSVSRVIAQCGTAACTALPAGGAGEDRLEKYIADNLPAAIGADYATLESGVVDEDTYVQQGRDLADAYGNAVLTFVLGTLQPDTDLALVGYQGTDEFSHQFLGLVTPTDMDGAPNPYYDDATGDGVADGRVAVRTAYLQGIYQAADAKLALARSLLGGTPTTFAVSDGGFAPQWYAVNAGKILFDAGLQSAETTTNCRVPAGAGSFAYAKACYSAGTAQVYVNPTLPAGMTYEQVRTQVISAFAGLTDPANPGKQVVLKIMKKEELRNVDGSDSLHPNRSGDVVVVLRPPYQFDAATPGQTFAWSQFFGSHGYLPELVDLAHNVNMRGVFVAGGPGVRKQSPIVGVRAVDVAPSVAYLMGVPGAQNARGRIMYGLSKAPGQAKEVAILSVSDFHGQLVPLAAMPDTLGPSYGIGGAAYLKPWFDWYRAEASMGSITVATGDSFGATPPISNFFGDTPTVQAMNLMGFSADALGNHNFDKGQAYLRNTLIPLATYPFLSSNVLLPTATGFVTPAEWSRSWIFDFAGGKVGVIGFSNQDIASLVPPGALDPFVTADPAVTVANEASWLKSKNVKAIVAIGHLGANMPGPTGPLVDLADSLAGRVSAVIGGETNVPFMTMRPGGVFVAENDRAGLTFTRLRVVFDPSSKKVTYVTGDVHKPWDIGVTPDPAIQAYIDELNAQLAAILGTVIGSSTRFIPRADACGRADGRLCESLIGDVTADSMRTATSVDFAITNAGGLRADLTCPTTDNPSDFCPPYTPPPYPITRGQVLTVLPFGNVVVTVQVNGAELKTMLENGVSRMPAADGRFPQVSGLCFTYDISAPAGSRVLSAVRQAADGSCTGAPVDLTAAGSYLIAENDFMAAGGDGYPNFIGREISWDYMDQTLADFITATSPVSPSIQGRVACTTSGGTACPVVVP